MIDDYVQGVFRWHYIGLPALETWSYARGTSNPWSAPLLGLMRHRPEDAAELAAEGFQQIYDLPGGMTQGKYLLAECMQTYLIRERSQQLDLDRLMREPKWKEVNSMVKTYFEQGVECGIERGVERGIEQSETVWRRRTLLEQLENQFGPVPNNVAQQLVELSVERLRELAKASLRAKSPTELGLNWPPPSTATSPSTGS